jgi:predicted nucleic acid-binding protein
MIVLDASSVVDLLLSPSTIAPAWRRILGPDESLHAPQLLDLEVTQVLRRCVLARMLTAERAGQAVEALRMLRVTRYSHLPLLARVWQLRHNLTAYDAAYVALAEELGATLLTRDAKLASATGHRARIELV